jgi:hypothetical protein
VNAATGAVVQRLGYDVWGTLTLRPFSSRELLRGRPGRLTGLSVAPCRPSDPSARNGQSACRCGCIDLLDLLPWCERSHQTWYDLQMRTVTSKIIRRGAKDTEADLYVPGEDTMNERIEQVWTLTLACLSWTHQGPER